LEAAKWPKKSSDPVATLDCLTQFAECQIRHYDSDDGLDFVWCVGGTLLTRDLRLLR
jgi:hypothetical protein